MIDFPGLMAYATDPDAENEGRWIDEIFRDGISVKIRSMHSDAARAAQAIIDKRNRLVWKVGNDLTKAQIARNEREIACAVVVDWKGIVDSKGAAVACTPEVLGQIFGDERLWEFRQLVIGAAANTDNYRPQAV